MTSALPSLPASPLTFSQELRDLTDRFADCPVRLGQILDAMKGRGFDLLLVFITLPFITPIPLPGFSLPFGLTVAVIGARLALGKKPWLPAKLLKRELPPRFLARVLRAAGRIVRALEFFLRPRLAFMNDHLIFRRTAGALIACSGILMLLPLPVPFSNSLPALTVLLLAAGALERDGAFFLAGCTSFLISLAYFLFLLIGGAHFLDGLWDARA